MEFEDTSSNLPLLLNYPVHLNEDSISACSEPPLTPLIMSHQNTPGPVEEDSTNSNVAGTSVVSMTPVQDESTLGSTFSQSQTKLSIIPEAEDSRSSYDSFKPPLAVVCQHEEDSQNSLIKTQSITRSEIIAEEDSQSSVVSQKSSGTKRRWDMVEVSEKSAFSAENLFEYQWPLSASGKSSGGEYYILQEQISEFLGVKSFKRKYPDLQRRPVDMDEKEYLKERGIVTETQCDLGLTALRADEVIDLMVKDYFDKYQDYERILHEKEKRSINEKHRDYTAPSVEKSKMAEFIKKSVLSAAEWNSSFNRERKEERNACFDLQTNIVHYPMGARAKLEANECKTGIYPVALIPGQFHEYYKCYTEAELKYLPLNTCIYGPLKLTPPLDVNSNTDGSQSDSDDTSSGSSSDTTRDGSDSNAGEKNVGSRQGTPSFAKKKKTLQKRKSTPSSDKGCRLCDRPVDAPKDLIQCANCKKKTHLGCLHFSNEMLDTIRNYSWQCMDCKMCSMCNEASNEDTMMFCDRCDRGYHTFCVGLKGIPQGPWICSVCGHCGQCGVNRPGGAEATKAQWNHQYTKLPNGKYDIKQTLCLSCTGKSVDEGQSTDDKRPVRLQLRMKRFK